MSRRILNMNTSKRKPGPTPRWHDVGNVCPKCGRSVRGATMGTFVEFSCVCGATRYQCAASMSGSHAYLGGEAA